MTVGRNEDLLRVRLLAKEVNWISIAPITAPVRASGEDSQQARGGRGHAVSYASQKTGKTASRCILTSRSAPSRPARERCFTTAIWCSAEVGSNRLSRQLRLLDAGAQSAWAGAVLPGFWISSIRACAGSRGAIWNWRIRSILGRTRNDCRSGFCFLARMLWTFARLPSINAENSAEWIRYDGLEHFLEAKKHGRGVLFATAHLGNWELSAFAHALLTEPMDIVVRPLDYSGIDEVVEARRQLPAIKSSANGTPPAPILRGLAANRAVGILMDQNTYARMRASSSISSVRRRAPTWLSRKSPHALARPVIPGFAMWSERKSLHSQVLSAGPDDRRGRPGHPSAPLRAGTGDPGTSRPVAMDSSALENRPPGEPPIYS